MLSQLAGALEEAGPLPPPAGPAELPAGCRLLTGRLHHCFLFPALHKAK